MGTIIMLVVLVGMIWFMQRSQKENKLKNVKNQLKALAKGDEIVTIGGLYGVVDEVDEDNQKNGF